MCDCGSADEGELEVRADVGQAVELAVVLLNEYLLSAHVCPKTSAAVCQILLGTDLFVCCSDDAAAAPVVA